MESSLPDLEEIMTFQDFINLAGIPLLVFAILLYFGFKMLVLGDAYCVRGKKTEPLNDEKLYAKEGGKLLIAFALAAFLMGILLLFSVMAGVIFIVSASVLFAVLWKRLEDRYGSVDKT